MTPDFGKKPPLFVFDLDSTITQCETLPRLAREAGVEAEMALRTERSMRGEVPFAPDFRARVRMLQTLSLRRVRAIMENIPLNPQLAAFIVRNPQRCQIVTGNLDVWIGPILDKLGMNGRCLCSQAVVSNGIVTDVAFVLDKRAAAQSMPHPFIAVGDGENDAALLKCADYGIAFGGVRNPGPKLLAAADWVTDDESALCAFLERFV